MGTECRKKDGDTYTCCNMSGYILSMSFNTAVSYYDCLALVKYEWIINDYGAWVKAWHGGNWSSCRKTCSSAPLSTINLTQDGLGSTQILVASNDWMLEPSNNPNKDLESYVYWTVHHLDSWIKRDQLDVTCFFISLFNVSDVLTSKTCWALNNEIKKQVTSSWSPFIQGLSLIFPSVITGRGAGGLLLGKKK